MSSQHLTFLFVGLTFALYSYIAWRSKASSTKEFYVAGGGVSPFTNAMATAADLMSVATMLSIPGILSVIGYDGAPYLLGTAGGFVLLGILIAPYLRRFGKYTIPDFIGDRYYSNAARSIAVFCALAVSLTYLAGQMRGVGVVFSRFLEIDINLGVCIGAGIVFLYAVWGGMKGITYTQVAQFCVLIFAFLIPIIFLSIVMTNNAFPFTSWGGKAADGSMFLLDKLNGLNAEFGFKSFTDQSRPTIDMFCLGLTLMLGTAGLPHIIVRYFTVKKVSDARKSIAYTLLLISIVFLASPAVSVFSRTYIMETITNLPYAEVPNWFKTWENIGLITFQDLNGDGIIQYVAGAQNELTIDSDIVFLAIPEIAQLGNWVTALLAAGALAAALSTAAGLLLVISTSVSHDLIKMQFVPQMSDKHELLTARICASVAVLIGIYFGMNPPGFIVETIALAFSIASSAFFPALVLGIFSKRINKQGAIAGMLGGLIFSVAYIVYFQFLGGKETHGGYWLDISPQGIGVVGVMINFGLIFLVSAFYPPPPQDVQELVERIRYPKGL